MPIRWALCALFLIISANSFAQRRRVPDEALHHRMYAIVPMVGKGTWADPVRPKFAPTPAELAKTPRSFKPTLPSPIPATKKEKEKDAVASQAQPNRILGFAHVMTDDKKHALVEFVALDPSAFDAMKGDSEVLKSFEKGKDSRDDIEKEFQTRKKGFKLEDLKVVVR